MEKLVKTKIFNLLAESSSTVINDEMKNAYETFVKETFSLNQSEADYFIVFRSLNMTRIELQSLQTQILYEQGEKCLEKSLLAESHFFY